MTKQYRPKGAGGNPNDQQPALNKLIYRLAQAPSHVGLNENLWGRGKKYKSLAEYTMQLHEDIVEPIREKNYILQSTEFKEFAYNFKCNMVDRMQADGISMPRRIF